MERISLRQDGNETCFTKAKAWRPEIPNRMDLQCEGSQGLFLPFPGTNSPPKMNGVRRWGLPLTTRAQANPRRSAPSGHSNY
jgi:hypothetical protein